MMRIIDSALALDGGTQIIVLEIGNGEKIAIGLDGRMDSPNFVKQVFIGNSPDSPDTRMLPIGGIEERKVISLLENWADETQGFIRREALMEVEQSTLQGQDLLDRTGLQFLLELQGRDVA